MIKRGAGLIKQFLWWEIVFLLLCTNTYAGMDLSMSSPVENKVLTEVQTKIDMLDAYIFIYQDLPEYKDMFGYWDRQFKKYKNHVGKATEFDLMISDKVYQKVMIILQALKNNHKDIAQKEMVELRKNFEEIRKVGSVIISSAVPIKEE